MNEADSFPTVSMSIQPIKQHMDAIVTKVREHTDKVNTEANAEAIEAARVAAAGVLALAEVTIGNAWHRTVQSEIQFRIDAIDGILASVADKDERMGDSLREQMVNLIRFAASISGAGFIDVLASAAVIANPDEPDFTVANRIVDAVGSLEARLPTMFERFQQSAGERETAHLH